MTNERQAYDKSRAERQNSGAKPNQEKTRGFNQSAAQSRDVQKSDASGFNRSSYGASGKRAYGEIRYQSPKGHSFGLYAGDIVNSRPDGQGTFYNAASNMVFVGEWKNGVITKGVEYTEDQPSLYVFEGDFTFKNGIRGHGIGRRFFYNPFTYSFNETEKKCWINKSKAEEVDFICEADFSKQPVIGKIYAVHGGLSLNDFSYRKRLDCEGTLGVLTGEYQKQPVSEHRFDHDVIDSPIGKPYIYGYGKIFSSNQSDSENSSSDASVRIAWLGRSSRLLYEGELVRPLEPETVGCADRYGRGKLYDNEGNLIFEGTFGDDRSKFHFKGKEYNPRTGICIFEGQSGHGKFYDPDTGNLIYEGSYIEHHGVSETDTIKGHRSTWNSFPVPLVKHGMGKEYNPRTGAVVYEGEFINGKRKQVGLFRMLGLG